MIGYIVRRLLIAIPVLLGVVVAVFFLARLIPGNPCAAMLGERATEEACAEFDRNMGLDRSLPVQLGIYVGNVFQGDFGTSLHFRRPVTQLLVERLPLTVELALFAMFFAIAIGVPLGILAARRHNTSVDVAAVASANIGVSMPIFWLGLVMAWIFAIKLPEIFNIPDWARLPPSGRLPPGMRYDPFWVVWGMEEKPGGVAGFFADFITNMATVNAFISAQWEVFWVSLKHLILPAITVATIPVAIITRMTRSSLLDVMGRDYVRTARAKGAGERRVLNRHALRNAMLPVSTIIGLQLGTLLGGAILTETVFGLAGMGTALLDAISARDFAVIQGFTLIISATYVVVNMAVDVSYGYLDPRVRLE